MAASSISGYESEGLNFTNALMAAVALFLLPPAIKQTLVPCRRLHSVTEEKQCSLDALRYFNDDEQRLQSRLQQVIAVDDQPKQWVFHSLDHKDMLIDTDRTDLIDLMDKSISVHTDVVRALEKNKTTDGKQWFANWKTVQRPGLRTWRRQCLPFYNAGGDFQTKFRCADQFLGLSFILLLGVNGPVATTINRLSEKEFAYTAVGVGLFLVAGAWYESMLMREQQLRLETIGIQRRIRPYYDFPPTCVGQQMTAQWLFAGPTSKFQRVAEFVAQTHQLLSDMPNEVVVDKGLRGRMSDLQQAIDQSLFNVPELQALTA